MSDAPSSSTRAWPWRGWHFALLALGFLVRAVYCLKVSREDAFAVWDGREYYFFARHLLAFQGDDYPRFFNFIRSPGYPLFLMPFLALDGVRLGHIQFVQCLLGVLQPCLLGVVAARWAGPRAGNWAFGLAMFHPFLIFYCAYLFTETLFIALLWFSLYCLQRLAGNRREDVWRWLSWAGVAMGFACLVRPALQPFLVVAVLWLGVPAWRAGGFRAAAARVGWFTAVVSALLLPWQLGNLWVHGEFSLGPYYGKAVYLQSNSKDFVDMYEAKTKDEYYAIFGRSANYLSITNGVSPERWMAEAKEFQRDRRDLWWRLQYYKLVHFWRPWLNPLIFSKAMVALSAVVTAPVFALAFLELWRRRRQWDPMLVLLMALAGMGFVIGGLLFVASVRYRIPMVDLTFLILASAWLGHRSWRASPAPRAHPA